MAEKDWEFLLSCVKHTATKPDFEQVAKELGLPSSKTAYHRHWAIMKKHGVAGNSGKGRPASLPTTSKITKQATPTKRGKAGAKKNNKITAAEDQGNDEELAEESETEVQETKLVKRVKAEKNVKEEDEERSGEDGDNHIIINDDEE